MQLSNSYHPNQNTQSQIINTLNSSIEDLLSKISKVQLDYQISAHSLYHPQSNNDSLIKQNIKSKKQDTSTQSSTKKMPSNQIQNKTNFEYYRPHSNYQLFNNTPKKTVMYPNMSKAMSVRQIIPQSQQSTGKQIKSTRIHSLFQSESIKQVQASQIFGQIGLQGKFDKLQNRTRQVQEITIPIPQKQQHKFSLSDFQIGVEVGSGKFGQVYLCRHKLTGCIFALKKIFKSTIKEYKMQNQFCLQLKILYLLNHPNIIKLYTHFSDEYHIFLLMEYIEGGQLLSKLKSNQRYVSRIVDQIIDTVDYIHNRGIIHRDIKPQNIVISFDNTAKLCDFGWAGFFDNKNMKKTFCGTLDYVSPQMKDKGIYTSKVDLWSIGVLTFQLLTGCAPFKDQINQWRKKGSKRAVHWDWHILYPPQITALAESFMRNLLRQNPDQRASLRFCKNHFFIRKHKETQNQINIQIYV